MTKQEAEPIILNLFYRDTGLTRTNLTPREQEAVELWRWSLITIEGKDYNIVRHDDIAVFFPLQKPLKTLTRTGNMGDSLKV